MDKENNPAPENDSGDKGQEEKPTTFTQEQVNDIVSKRLAEANTKAEKKPRPSVRVNSLKLNAKRNSGPNSKRNSKIASVQLPSENAKPMLKMHCLIEISTQTS